jgi:hypothetical protein
MTPPVAIEPTPFREPLWRTVLRTVAIALIVGVASAWRAGSLPLWPSLTLVALWFTFGGHWVEVLFLNVIRPRLPASRMIRIVARLAIWFAGGIVLGAGASFTAARLAGLHPSWPLWWFGVGFVVLELLVHLPSQLLRRSSFYDGRA